MVLAAVAYVSLTMHNVCTSHSLPTKLRILLFLFIYSFFHYFRFNFSFHLKIDWCDFIGNSRMQKDYAQQPLQAGCFSCPRRSTTTRSAFSGLSLPDVASKMASASSQNARSIFMLALADVSINRMPCSRAICIYDRR